MNNTADPSDGWPTLEIQGTPSPSPRDWYGKLFTYLHNMFERFLNRLANVQVAVELFNVDVKELPPNLTPDKYARIEI
jgi:hypothetical protein